MTVKIGSARVDERGKYSGGQAGSQIDKEISRQDWYLHSKGWVLIRPKDSKKAEKIAKNMEYACDSKYVGYDQGQNTTLYKVVKEFGFDISKLKTKCETDCARLVRVCVKYAGINASDFYTATEVNTLKATGEFKILTSDKYCKSSDYLKRGDILVTKTKGHTVVVLSNGSKASSDKVVVSNNTTSNDNVNNSVATNAASKNPTSVKIDPAKSFDKTLHGNYKTTANLNMRAGAGTSKKILTIIPKDGKVTCYGYYTSVNGVKWYYVTYKTFSGFVSSKYLKK